MTKFSQPSTVLIISLIAVALILRWQISILKPFDPDELTHLHTSWLVTHGSLPYKDFFTGYPPTFALIISPFVSLFTPSDFALIAARQFFLGLFILTLFLIYKIGRLALSRDLSLFAPLLTAISVLSLERGVEIRPDNLLIPLWLAAAYLLVTVPKDLNRKSSFVNLLLPGLLTGLAAVVTQKAVYGTIFIFTLVLLSNWKKSTFKLDLIRRLIPFLFGFTLLPALLALLLFSLGLGPYLYDFLIKYPLNLSQIYGWDHPWYILGFVPGFTGFTYFTYLYKDSLIWLQETQITWLAAAISLPFWLFVARRASPKNLPQHRQSYILILITGLIFFTAYLLTIHVKLPQYYLFLNPFVSMLLVFGLSEFRRVLPLIGNLTIISLFLLVTFTVIGVWSAWTRDLPTNNNLSQRQDIKDVLTFTSPDAKGYDGVGAYIFRKDCFYFGMVLPQEIPKPIFRDIIEPMIKGDCDFILNGLFGRMNHWNKDENNYVTNNFSAHPQAPRLNLKNP